MKKYFLAIIVLVLIFIPINVFGAVLVYDGVSHEYNVPPINLFINGREITNLQVAPVIINDYTYVSAREMFEAIGAKVDWISETNSVAISYAENMVLLQIDNMNISVNGEITVIPFPPKNVNDKVMIPVRFAAEPLGFDVDWDDINRRVILTSSVTNENKPPVIEENNEGDKLIAEEVIVSSSLPVIDKIDNVVPAVNIGINSLPEAVTKSIDVSPIEILSENQAETAISKLVLPTDEEVAKQQYSYQILAETAISKVEKFLLPDNRLVIDIYNAEMKLTETTFPIKNDIYLSMVHVGQNQLEPIKITRVVFTIDTPVSYSVVLSEDRNNITVSFERNEISGVEFVSDEFGENIIITGKTTPVVSVYPLFAPHRLVIDLPLSVIDVIGDLEVNGEFAKTIRSSQFSGEMARIVVDLEKEPSFLVISKGNSTHINLTAPTYKNIDYTSSKMMLAIPKKDIAIDIKDIICEDRYDIYKYIFTLPDDYSQFLGYGEKVVNDSYINTINISTVNGKTVITFNENQILAFAITEDDENIYFNAMHPKEMYSRIVVIDPGHGGSAPGTSGFGMIERDVNLDIALKLIAMLEADSSIKVYSTRKTDVNPSFEGRAALGNDYGDLFISIHNNAAYSASASGSEVFYHEHAINSLYSISSKFVAELFHNNIITDLGLFDRKFKTDNFYVIKNSTIPAILIEVGFLSNEKDAKKLATQEFRQNAAASMYRSVKELFEKYAPFR